MIRASIVVSSCLILSDVAHATAGFESGQTLNQSYAAAQQAAAQTQADQNQKKEEEKQQAEKCDPKTQDCPGENEQAQQMDEGTKKTEEGMKSVEEHLAQRNAWEGDPTGSQSDPSGEGGQHPQGQQSGTPSEGAQAPASDKAASGETPASAETPAEKPAEAQHPQVADTTQMEDGPATADKPADKPAEKSLWDTLSEKASDGLKKLEAANELNQGMQKDDQKLIASGAKKMGELAEKDALNSLEAGSGYEPTSDFERMTEAEMREKFTKPNEAGYIDMELQRAREDLFNPKIPKSESNPDGDTAFGQYLDKAEADGTMPSGSEAAQAVLETARQGDAYAAQQQAKAKDGGLREAAYRVARTEWEADMTNQKLAQASGEFVEMAVDHGASQKASQMARARTQAPASSNSASAPASSSGSAPSASASSGGSGSVATRSVPAATSTSSAPASTSSVRPTQLASQPAQTSVRTTTPAAQTGYAYNSGYSNYSSASSNYQNYTAPSNRVLVPANRACGVGGCYSGGSYTYRPRSRYR